MQNGATLIQKRRPNRGNQKFFFERSKTENEQGFGYTAKEFWLGLDGIQKLNAAGNTILRIEGTLQNQSEFWVEYKIKDVT